MGYGWMLNIDRCTYLETDAATQIYAVNLARPWTSVQLRDDLIGPPRDAEQTALLQGGLFLPWEWEGVTWSVWGRPPATPAAVNPPLQRIADALQFKPGCDVGTLGADAIRDALTIEVRSKVQDCQHLFSLAPEAFWGEEASPRTTRSLPHVLAPLTHWPAMASGGLLRLSGFLIVDAAAVFGFEHLACFPQFTFRDENKNAVQAALSSVPTYAASDKPAGQATGVYDGGVVAMSCLCAKNEVFQLPPNADTQPVVQISQGLVTPATLLSLAYDALAPLPLLARWVGTVAGSPALSAILADNDGRRRWALALWRTLGSGEERAGLTAVPNVIRFFVVPTATADVMSAGVAAMAAPSDDVVAAAANDVFKNLTQRSLAGDKSVSIGSRTAWLRLQADWQRVLDAGATPDAVVTAWRSVADALRADEGQRSALGPWLAAVLDPAFPDTDPNHATWVDLQRRLRDDIGPQSGGVFVGMQHLARVRAGLLTPAQWAAMPLNGGGESGVAVDRAALIGATCDALRARLTPTTYDLSRLSLDTYVAQAVSDFVQSLQDAAAPERARSFDQALNLRLESAELPGDDWDQRIRGYAVGLCAGLQVSGGAIDRDLTRAAWITDSALYGADARQWLCAAPSAPGLPPGLSWMADTVGSTEQDGQRTSTVSYDGRPIAVPLSRSAADVGVDASVAGADASSAIFAADESAVRFRWRSDLPGGRPLPLLGYGLAYQSVAVAVDNAGGVMAASYRNIAAPQWTGLATLLPIDPAWLTASPLFFYRSSEPPSAPALPPAARRTPRSADDAARLYGCSEESRAHRYQHELLQRGGTDALGGKPSQVAVLVHGQTLVGTSTVGSSRVDLQACKLEYSIVSPK